MFESSIRRRDFLKTAAAGAAGSLLMANSSVAADKKDPYGGFKMCIQSYSLRGFDVETALKHSKTHGIWFRWNRIQAHRTRSD